MVCIACFWIFFFSPRLLLVFAVVIVVMAVITKKFTAHIQQLNREVRDEAGRINARITEDIYANSLIRAFAREQAFSERIRQHSALFLSKVIHTARIFLKPPIVIFDEATSVLDTITESQIRRPCTSCSPSAPSSPSPIA